MVDDAPKNRPILTVCVVGIAVGIAFISLGLAWPKVVTPAMVWSPEQAAALKEAADAYHAARGHGEHDHGSHQHGQESDHAEETNAATLASAEQRYNKLQAELEKAQRIRTNWGTWVAAAGFALTIGCGLGYLVARGN